MLVAIPQFERFAAPDAGGPYEVLQQIPSIDVMFLDSSGVRSDNGMLGVTVDKSFAELTQPDVVVFPGGIDTRVLINDSDVLDWVREAHEHSRFTTPVCTGGQVGREAAEASQPADDRIRPAAAVSTPATWRRPPRRSRSRRGSSTATGPDVSNAISQLSHLSCSLARLPTQATLLPRNDRGRT